MSKVKHDWAALVEAHARSGLTQKAFCAEHGIHPVTFCQQRRRRRQATRRGQEDSGRPRAFIEARLGAGSMPRRWELSLGVMTLRFDPDTSPAYVAALVDALS